MTSQPRGSRPSSWSGGVGGFVLSSACFALALAAVCSAIHQALPLPDVPMVSPKVAHLAAHADRYDTLFFGSSRLYYQVIPSTFDEFTAQAGIATKSFNAGIAGMSPPEDAFVLDEISRHPPQRLRWVFLELATLRLSIDRNRVGTVRYLYWHDWPRLAVLFRRALVQKQKRRSLDALLELREPLAHFMEHLQLYAQNMANVGRASLWTDRLQYPARRERFDPLALGPKGDGWMRAGRPEQMTERELANYERSLADRVATPAKKDLGDPVSQAALEAMLGKIEKLGARPVLVVPPTTSKRNFFPSPERESSTIVLDFSDIQKFPQLYRPEYRLDPEHLNTAGAEVFTRVLAEEFQRALASRR